MCSTFIPLVVLYVNFWSCPVSTLTQSCYLFANHYSCNISDTSAAMENEIFFYRTHRSWWQEPGIASKGIPRSFFYDAFCIQRGLHIMEEIYVAPNLIYRGMIDRYDSFVPTKINNG